MLAAIITAALDARQLQVRFRARPGNSKMSQHVQSFLAALYSVPSLALFALMIPLMGIGPTTAIVVLVAYNQYLLVRNFSAGLASVDRGLVEGARSLGCSKWTTFVHVQLPLAAPVFIAGIRIAAISTIGIATIASLIDAGGLGTLMFQGLRTGNLNQLLWATVLAAGLALIANAGLNAAQKLFARDRSASAAHAQ